MQFTPLLLTLLLPFILTQQGYDDFNPASSPSSSFSSLSPSSSPSSPSSSPSFLQKLVEQAQVLADGGSTPGNLEAPSFKSRNNNYLKTPKNDKPDPKNKEDKKKDKNEVVVQGKRYTPETIERLTKLLGKLVRNCGEQLEPKEQELLKSFSYDVPMTTEGGLGESDEFDKMVMSNEIEDDLIDLGLK